MTINSILIDLASARLRALKWERQQAFGVDHGQSGFDWERWQDKNKDKETEIILLQNWLKEAQQCA